MDRYLQHYGIKGQKWGVRRYQNSDGSLTAEGKERYMYANRARRASKTKSDMDRLYNTLSKDDKRLLGDDENSKEWLSNEQGEYVVKRFLSKHGDEPIAALDIMTTTNNHELTIAVMTNPKYRGSGEASKLAEESIKWFEKNAKKYGANRLDWSAHTENKSSRHIAEKSGFKYNKKSSNDEWSSYHYTIKKK